jgi:hypothetical protein
MSPPKNVGWGLPHRITSAGQAPPYELSGLCAKRQKGHKSCAFYCVLDLALAAGTIAAAFAGVYLAAMRQQFLQGLDILVIHVLLASPAEPALGLLRCRQLTGVVRPVISSFASVASSVLASSM